MCAPPCVVSLAWQCICSPRFIRFAGCKVGGGEEGKDVLAARWGGVRRGIEGGLDALAAR